MKRNWIEYNDPPPRLSTGMYVTLNKGGEIFFNKKVFEAFGEPKAVRLLYDPDTDCIGLRPAEIRTPNAFEVKSKSQCGGRRVYAKGFIQRHDIRYGGTAQFLDTTVDEGVLVLNLRKTRIVKRRPKGQTRKR